MKIGTVFSSHLKAEDISTSQPAVMIRKITVEDIGKGEDKERKPVMYFEDKEKGLVLNKTNANMITEIFGTDETDEWIGQRLRLYVTKVDFGGKRVDAIRVKEYKPIATTKRKPEPEPEPEPELADEELDEIPF